MRSNGGSNGALIMGFETLELIASFFQIESTIMWVSILATVVDKEISKTKTRFLADWDMCWHNGFFIKIKIHD